MNMNDNNNNHRHTYIISAEIRDNYCCCAYTESARIILINTRNVKVISVLQ